MPKAGWKDQINLMDNQNAGYGMVKKSIPVIGDDSGNTLPGDHLFEAPVLPDHMSYQSGQLDSEPEDLGFPPGIADTGGRKSYGLQMRKLSTQKIPAAATHA
jgi:hypothetical protein